MTLDVLDLVYQASWIVQAVLALLVVMSVVSWTIIAFKWRELRRAAQDSEAFIEVYHDGTLDASFEAARDLDRSPLAAIFLAAYGELNRMARFSKRGRVDEDHVDVLARHIHWAGATEVQRMERGLSFLATTGSAAPFIGLFGTVVGIINAFHGIGRAGSASLAVVAPGIAEALIATAVGLFAAIPATIFYNTFASRLRGLVTTADLFSLEFERDLRKLARSSGENPVRAAGS